MGVKEIDWTVTAVLGGIIAAFFGGIGLAYWYSNAAWLIISAIAFCVLYAG